MLSSPVAKLAYILCFASFMYHFLNGIRHLLWDAGLNLEIASVFKSAMLLTIMLFLSTVAFLFVFI
ncbi:succinate dehydrogenase, cytochrome b556 subunit [Wolbachia endosymbiont of Trichogramma pretiosum]|nr:succinate dehydrogenase, cytochrome b556 subunit [Wolbachia endosymbiont of Trichogramma pretiosum]